MSHHVRYTAAHARACADVPRIIVISGLPGSGKTSLAHQLARILHCAHVNADFVRERITTDLGFSPEDRIKQAGVMGSIASIIADSGRQVIVDFVCPTHDTRGEFMLNCRPNNMLNVAWFELSRPGNVCEYKDTLDLYQPVDLSILSSDNEWSDREWFKYAKFKHLVNNEQPINDLVAEVLPIVCPDADDLILNTLADVKTTLYKKPQAQDNGYDDIQRVLSDIETIGGELVKSLLYERFDDPIFRLPQDGNPNKPRYGIIGRWLKEVHHVPDEHLTRKNLNDYTHLWLDSVIAEYIPKFGRKIFRKYAIHK